jgi:hypothetical protein
MSDRDVVQIIPGRDGYPDTMLFWCQECGHVHSIGVMASKAVRPIRADGATIWGWNGDKESPTLDRSCCPHGYHKDLGIANLGHGVPKGFRYCHFHMMGGIMQYSEPLHGEIAKTAFNGSHEMLPVKDWPTCPTPKSKNK